jgi:hypothetical protein
MQRNRRRGLSLIVGALGLTLIATVCSRSDQPVAPLVAQRAFGMPAFSKVLPHARRDLGWIGDVHAQAMHELASNKALWGDKKNGTPAQRRCAALTMLVTRYTGLVGQHLGVDPAQVRAIVHLTLQKQKCNESRPLALWAPIPYAARVRAATQDLATGAYQSYVPGLEAAMQNGATPGDVAYGMDAVLSSATDLGPGDAMILDGLASIGVSSAYDWHDQEQSGALDTEIDAIRVYAMSIFPPPRPAMLSWWGGLGWADLAGSVSGAASLCEWTAGACVLVPEAALTAAAAGGIGGSAGYLIGIAFQ